MPIGGYKVPPGPSIVEMLWAEMDRQLGKLMSLIDDPGTDGVLDRRGQEGMCLGLAKALAIMLTPYDPDVDAIRAEAMERYQAGRQT